MSVVDRRIQRHVRLSTFFWWCHNYRCLHSRSYQSAANRLNKWWLPTPLYRTEWKDIWISQALTELPLQTINWWSNWHHAVMAVGSGWLLCTRTWSNFDVCRVYCVSVCNVHDVWGVVMLVSQVRRLSGLSRKHTLAHIDCLTITYYPTSYHLSFYGGWMLRFSARCGEPGSLGTRLPWVMFVIAGTILISLPRIKLTVVIYLLPYSMPVHAMRLFAVADCCARGVNGKESTFSHRAFSIAGPTVWNSLPDSLHNQVLSSNSFRQSLKTNLFCRRDASLLCAT